MEVPADDDELVTGFTVAANLAPYFFHCYVKEDDLTFKDILDKVLAVGLAFDQGGKMEDEWFEKAVRNEHLRRWHIENLRRKTARYARASLEHEIKNKIEDEFGCPHDDVVYFECANKTLTKYIISHNYHLYWPKCPKKLHTKTMEAQAGELLRFASKKLSITVSMLCHVQENYFD